MKLILVLGSGAILNVQSAIAECQIINGIQEVQSNDAAVTAETAEVSQTVTDENDAEVRTAIEQLKSDGFVDRQQAIDVLFRFPKPALEQIQALQTDFDAEFTLQIQRLATELRQKVVDQTLQKFVAQKQSAFVDIETTGIDWSQELPVWSLFVEQLGDSLDTRKLYSEALRENWNDFAQLSRKSIDSAEAIELLMSKDTGRSRLQPAVVATILLLANDETNWGNSGMQDRLMAEMENRLTVNSHVFQSERFSKSNRKLLIDWCKNRSIGLSQFGSYHSFLQLSIVCKIHEAFPRLIEIVKDTRIPAYARGTALIYAIALARPSDVSALEPLLVDRTVVANAPADPVTNRKLVCLVSDYALLGLAIHSGLELEKVGFEGLEVNNMLNVDRNKIGFAETNEREAAISVWRTYAKNSKDAQK